MDRIIKKKRREYDLLGEVKIPTDALYGAQTQRAIDNFPGAEDRTIGKYKCLVDGLMRVKQAAAKVNGDHGFLSDKTAQVIVESAKTVIDENLYDQFPVFILHGGGGTSANMNANEVIANMSEEKLGGIRGEYKIIHPNDHVNLHQSTNDVYPTACHIAIISKWPVLKDALDILSNTLAQRAEELENKSRIARTCLQDAVDTTFGDLLGGYRELVERGTERIGAAVDSLHSVNLGGTIIGRRIDVPESYFDNIIKALAGFTGDPDFRVKKNLYDAAQNIDDMALVSSELALMARGLIKVAHDFRLMSSGPETGLGEIILPAVQPGSSIMPGKVNPVIPEYLIQLCFQVIGANEACMQALTYGELDLNIWESTMVCNILESIYLLTNGVKIFEEKCVRGFKICEEKNRRNAESIMPLLTRLAHDHGYSVLNNIFMESKGDMNLLRKLLQARDLI